MKEFLAPGLTQQAGDLFILWFENSNQYLIIDKSLYTLIEAFFDSKTRDDFTKRAIKSGHDTESATRLFKDISTFLEDRNVKTEVTALPNKTFSGDHRQESFRYPVDDRMIQVHYGSEQIKSLIHPQLEHLQEDSKDFRRLCEIDIYEEDGDYLLFKDKVLAGSWPTRDYHLLQGKFAMHVLCAIHNNKEQDWIGTFHASALVKNNEAVMIIGDSGKGKSTFTALLLGQGYEILADDITAILARDSLVYPYPGGISIKAGSFDILKNGLPNFESLPTHYINPYKGYVKYVAAPKSKGYLKGYPCRSMVSINYMKDAETSLKTISVADALNTLIPESWLAAERPNAQQFLNWIKDVKFYELTYSDSQEAIKVFSTLFTE